MRVDVDTDSQMKSGRSARLQASRKRIVEVGAVLGVYILFLIVGLYSGETTMNIEIISPPEGTRFQSSPVELVVRATVKGAPVPDARMTFTVRFDEMGEANIATVTDARGIARLVLPQPSGNYTWHVTATREGYPTIVSRSGSFSINLTLIVHSLLPSISTIAVSPVNFVSRVTDMKNHLVTSANVTFYVDSRVIGSSLTATNGIAKFSSAVDPGRHAWFASASKGNEAGVSDPTGFMVGQPSSLATGDSGVFASTPYQPRGNNLWIALGKEQLCCNGSRIMRTQLISDVTASIPASRT